MKSKERIAIYGAVLICVIFGVGIASLIIQITNAYNIWLFKGISMAIFLTLLLKHRDLIANAIYKHVLGGK